jgi:hypothetical protein
MRPFAPPVAGESQRGPWGGGAFGRVCEGHHQRTGAGDAKHRPDVRPAAVEKIAGGGRPRVVAVHPQRLERPDVLNALGVVATRGALRVAALHVSGDAVAAHRGRRRVARGVVDAARAERAEEGEEIADVHFAARVDVRAACVLGFHTLRSTKALHAVRYECSASSLLAERTQQWWSRCAQPSAETVGRAGCGRGQSVLRLFVEGGPSAVTASKGAHRRQKSEDEGLHHGEGVGRPSRLRGGGDDGAAKRAPLPLPSGLIVCPALRSEDCIHSAPKI